MSNLSDSDLLQTAEDEKKWLELDIEEIQTEIVALQAQSQAKLEEIKRRDIVIEYIRSKVESISEVVTKESSQESEKSNAAQNQDNITFIDATLAILKEAGKPLHISTILDQIALRYGKNTNARNLSGNIGKDALNRFSNLGNNTWNLRENESGLLFRDLPEKPKAKRFVMTEAIREIVKNLNGKEFTTTEIFDKLHSNFPNEVGENRRSSVNSTLNNLIQQGELEKVRAGNFEQPAVFKAIS